MVGADVDGLVAPRVVQFLLGQLVVRSEQVHGRPL